MRGLREAAFFVVLCALAGAQEPSSLAGRKVVAIRFEGNRRYVESFLVQQIATKQGEAYDPGLIERDTRALRQFFATVTDTVVKPVEGGVEITFVVLDKMVVGQVILKGLARVREDDIRPQLSTRPGRPLLEQSLEGDREMIERLHRQKGYFFVDVHYYRGSTKKEGVEDIIFQVIPGPRVKVVKLVFEGADSVEHDELARILRNSDHYRKTWLGIPKLISPSSAYYDNKAIEQDRRKLEYYYEREGWLDVKAAYIDTDFLDDREEAVLRYRIAEGARYNMGTFRVEYAPDGLPEEKDRAYLAPAALESLSLLEFQKPYRFEDFAGTVRKIRNRLWERAYAKSTIQEEIVRDPETHVVNVKLTVRSGPKVKLGRIRIYGNRYTKDNVIRRQFHQGALPAEPLDIEELEASRTRLLALRYFGGMVRYGEGMDPFGLVRDPAAPEPDIWDTELEVEEHDTRNFNFGAGVSTDGGAYAQIAVTWNNFDIKKTPSSPFGILDADAFRGGGQTFSITAAPGTVYSNYGVSFANPAMWDSRWAFSTSFYRRVAFYDTYQETTDGMNVRVDRFLDPLRVWRVSLSYGFSWVTISNPDADAPQNALDIQGRTSESGITFILHRSKRREIDPFLNGNVTTLSTTLFGGPLGAEVDVVKVEFEHRSGLRILPTKGGGWHRASTSVNVDWAGAYADTPEVPIFERYFLGGRNLRGFEYREVGPRSNGSPEGGEFMITWSTQYTVPLTSREASGFGLDLVFFCDQGNLVTEASDFSFDTWRLSVGIGLAIGFGGPNQPPLLLDFGFPILKEDGDKKQLVSVAFERNF